MKVRDKINLVIDLLLFVTLIFIAGIGNLRAPAGNLWLHHAGSPGAFGEGPLIPILFYRP